MRHLMDESVYKDDNMQKLLSNYRSAYLQQADTQIRAGDAPGARRTMTRLRERLPLDWTAAYSGATIARQMPSRRALADVTRDYGLVARDVILREVGNRGMSSFVLERLRATGQLLRFSDAAREGGEMLEQVEPLTRPERSGGRVGTVDRIGLLYETAMCYHDAEEYPARGNVHEDVQLGAGTDPADARGRSGVPVGVPALRVGVQQRRADPPWRA